ncbi:hydroxypyruvate isomerase family protein [Rhodococcus qingshengii]|uniref:hydroxypyruvate isomerase family protein n=1 Tax=Rhodococcus qingshengii TaxID=334542 RepID=UPI001C8B1237|nr:TIM barrel protein [Rhodococcus qingshengii]MBX9152092.1 TIM barrel protein [Rhodococcus qingshengii]
MNCSTLFTHLPLAARLDRVRKAGFRAVESWWPFMSTCPRDREIEAFVRTVGDSGLRLAALNFTGGDMERGERGLVSVPGRESQFRDSVEVAMGIGVELGTRRFNALYGNHSDEFSLTKEAEVADGNLRFAATSAAERGAAVLLEPLSNAPDYPLRELADAAKVLARLEGEIPARSVLLLADLYHLSVNGIDLIAAVRKHARAIGHVQLADAPGRGAPGTGTVDLAGAMTELLLHGYTGEVALEYFTQDEDPFSWLI